MYHIELGIYLSSHQTILHLHWKLNVSLFNLP